MICYCKNCKYRNVEFSSCKADGYDGIVIGRTGKCLTFKQKEENNGI